MALGVIISIIILANIPTAAAGCTPQLPCSAMLMRRAPALLSGCQPHWPPFCCFAHLHRHLCLCLSVCVCLRLTISSQPTLVAVIINNSSNASALFQLIDRRARTVNDINQGYRQLQLAAPFWHCIGGNRTRSGDNHAQAASSRSSKVVLACKTNSALRDT